MTRFSRCKSVQQFGIQIELTMTDSNNNDTEVPEDQLEEQALHLNAEEICEPTKSKKTTKKRTCLLFTKNQFRLNRRNWIDIEPGKVFSL